MSSLIHTITSSNWRHLSELLGAGIGGAAGGVALTYLFNKTLRASPTIRPTATQSYQPSPRATEAPGPHVPLPMTPIQAVHQFGKELERALPSTSTAATPTSTVESAFSWVGSTVAPTLLNREFVTKRVASAIAASLATRNDKSLRAHLTTLLSQHRGGDKQLLNQLTLFKHPIAALQQDAQWPPLQQLVDKKLTGEKLANAVEEYLVKTQTNDAVLTRLIQKTRLLVRAAELSETALSTIFQLMAQNSDQPAIKRLLDDLVTVGVNSQVNGGGIDLKEVLTPVARFVCSMSNESFDDLRFLQQGNWMLLLGGLCTIALGDRLPGKPSNRCDSRAKEQTKDLLERAFEELEEVGSGAIAQYGNYSTWSLGGWVSNRPVDLRNQWVTTRQELTEPIIEIVLNLLEAAGAFTPLNTPSQAPTKSSLKHQLLEPLLKSIERQPKRRLIKLLRGILDDLEGGEQPSPQELRGVVAAWRHEIFGPWRQRIERGGSLDGHLLLCGTRLALRLAISLLDQEGETTNREAARVGVIANSLLRTIVTKGRSAPHLLDAARKIAPAAEAQISERGEEART